MKKVCNLFFFFLRAILSTLVIILFFAINLESNNQKGSSDQGQIQHQFKYLSLPDDLPLSKIQGILQDASGLMWFASTERLYCYDGYDFNVFPRDTDTRINWANYNITTILESHNGSIWVGTEKGLYRFSREHERIEPFSPGNNRKRKEKFQEHITCLFEDNDNHFWVGTRQGIFFLDTEQSKIHKINSQVIEDIVEDAEGHFWMATSKELFHLKKSDLKSQPIQIIDSEAYNNQIKNPNDLFVDSENNLWIGTMGSGLYRLKPGESTFSHFTHNPENPTSLSGNFVNHICEDNMGRIWIGFQQKGIDIFYKKSNLFFHQYRDPINPDSLSHDTITHLYQDRSFTIWIGTRSSGLNYWNSCMQKFRKYQNISEGTNSLQISSVYSICEDPEGKIWIGGYKGLDRFDPQTDQFVNISPRSGPTGNIQVVYINPHTKNDIVWLGLKNENQELKKLSRNTRNIIKEYDFDSIFDFKGTSVTALLAENKNTLWVGTDQGLFKMDIEKSTINALTSQFPQLNDLNDDQINVLYQDQNQNIWAGASRGGLICFNSTHPPIRYLYSPDDINSLSINEVLSIIEDQQERLWIGTSKGLNQFVKNNKTFIHYTKKNGLPDNTITGILPEAENHLWLSTKKGLSHFDIDNKTIRNFILQDGLQSNTFNTGAYYKTRSGQLFFGGIRGLNCFYPYEVQTNQYIPPVRITNFKIFNKSMQIWQSKTQSNSLQKSFSEFSEVNLSHKENIFTFNFSALNYIFPEKNEYAIKMEGLEENWNYIKHLRHATYSGIPPGEYTFRVRASNNEGIWNEKGTAVRISITPPFFSNTWIRLLGLLIALLFIGLLYFNRTYSIRKKVDELKRKNLKLNQEIKEKLRSEEEIRASEKKYRHLVESSNDPIFILHNRKFELINEKFKQLFSVSQEYVCRPEFDYLELISLKSKNFVERKFQQILDEKKAESQFNFTTLTSDQKELEVEASVTTILYKGGIAVQGILRDITERKNMEKMIQQAQKLEALGTLAGGIAHDFNNLLTGIQGRVSLMQIGFDKKSSPKDHLKEIEHYVRNAADLTKQLLGFARKGKFEVKPININNLVRDNVLMFGRTKKEIGIRAQYQDDISTVEVDPGQMDQVFMNLFVNAWQAMPESGDILIETRNVYLDYNQTKPHLVEPGKFIKISVTDTGKGMDDETKQRIFDPFFTTKERGRGTGLGLATVYGILKNHGGFITVHSELDIGSTFDIFLPASSKQPVVEKVVKEDLVYGTETILLVDDEEIVIEVVGQIMESLGYNVFVARSGQEAIEIYWGRKKEIELVVLDMVMPKMSGGVTFERLKGINPNVKILLSSGYSVDGQASELLKRGCNGFIQKPFNIKELSKKIRDVLDEKPSNQDSTSI
jgi:PAS domain S-box-containing protein